MTKVVKAVAAIGFIALGVLTGGVAFLPGTALAFTVSASTFLVMGLALASSLLAPSPGGGRDRAASAASLQIGEVPRQAVFGRTATAGSLVDAFNYGGKYGTDWEVLVIALADHRCDALESIIVNDSVVAFAGDGAVAGFSGQLEVYFRDGQWGQTVPAILTNHGSGWTANDRGRGVTYAVVAYKADKPDAKTPVWPGGRPRFRFVLRGMRCYQARKDSSIGGSGSHRRDNPATWEWTENPIDIRHNWVRGIYAGDLVGQPEMLLVGRGLSAIEAPPQNVFARANLCDELVGGAPRYRIGGVVEATEPYIDVESDFAAACAGVIVQPEGSVEIDPGEARAPVAHFTDDDLLVGSKVRWSDFLGDGDQEWINTAIALFTDPAQLWRQRSAPPRRDIADIAADGRPREQQMTLSMVSWMEQAQRVAEIARRMGRLWGRGQVTLPPRFSGLEEGDWVTWQSNRRFGGATRTFRIEAWSSSKAWHHQLTLRQISASVYSDTAPLDDGSVAAPQPLPGVISVPGAMAWALSAGMLDAGGVRTPAMIVTGAVDDPAASAIRMEYYQGAVAPGPGATWTDAGLMAPDVMRREIPVAAGGTYYLAISHVVDGATGDRRVLGPVTVAAVAYPDGSPLAPPQLGVNVRDESGSLLFDPEVITAEGIAAGFLNQGALATKNAANFYSDIANAPQQLTNLINKGDFTDGSRGTWLQGTVYEPAGLPFTKALLFGETTGGGNVNYEVTPGGTGPFKRPIREVQTIFVVAWAYYVGPAALDFGAEFFDKNGASLGVVNGAQSHVGGWTFFRTTITAPTGAVSFVARPRITSTAPGYSSGAFAMLEYSVFEIGATVGARLGAGGNLLRENGLTKLTDVQVVTGEGISAGFVNQGALSTKNNVTWSGDVTGRPDALTNLVDSGQFLRSDRISHPSNLVRLSAVFPAEFGANVTESRVSAAIAGQTAWATLTAPTTRLNRLSDTGNFDSLEFITSRNLSQLTGRAWTNLYRANGTTPIVDADAITSQGVAAGFLNQGALATKNTIAGDADLSGQLALRLQPSPVDSTYLSTSRIAWDAGSTVESLKPAEIGSNKTETRTAAAIAGQGPGATAPANDVLNYKQENGTTFIPAPQGASNLLTNLMIAPGAIRIDLPVLWTNSMMRFQVEVFDYASHAGVTYLIGGYNYTGSGSGGYWVNPFAQMIGRATRAKTVRFGSYNGKACVWIGNPTDTWSYLTVRVTNFFARGSVYSTFATGWSLALDTAPAANNDGFASLPTIANPSAADAVFGSNTFETVGGAAATLTNFKTALGTSAAFLNQGGLATKNNVDLASSEVINKSLANLDSTANTKLTGIEAGADVTATAQRTIVPQYPVIEIKEGEAGNTGNRTVTHAAKRGTTTLTGGTWSLPSTNVGAGSATISSSTGTVTLSGIVASGAYTTRYTHTDGAVTELPVNVTYVPAASGGTVSAKSGTSSSTTGVGNNNNWTQVISLTLTNCPAGRLFFNKFGLSAGTKIAISTGTGTCSHAARLLINGSAVATLASQPTMSGGAVEFFSADALFNDAYAVPSGTVTVSVELQRTTGTGTITAMNNKLDCNVIAS